MTAERHSLPGLLLGVLTSAYIVGHCIQTTIRLTHFLTCIVGPSRQGRKGRHV